MSRRIPVLFLALATCASAVLTSARVTSSLTDQNSPATSTSTVAYVYVSSTTSNTASEIHAYNAASNGRLTAVTGSPFSADVQSMAVNGKYLFGTNRIDIFTYTISPDGALTKVATTASGTIGGGPANLFLDHPGATLYDGDVNAGGFAHADVVSDSGRQDAVCRLHGK